MSEYDAGYATLQVIPSMRGVDALITKQLGGLVGIGRRGGADLGGGLVGGMTTVVGGASSNTAKVVKGLVAGGLVGAGALVAGFVGKSIGVSKEFEKSLSGVAAVSGATTAEMETLRNKALQLGADTAFTSSEAASAMEELVKAGVPVAGVLGGAADATVALAAAGGVALPEAASIAANAMNQFKLSASDLPGIADQIAGAANASAIDVSDFGLSMSQAGAVANLVGLSFDDTALAITAMGNAGIKGSDAGTSLKTFLMNLEPSTAKASTRMKELGIITDEAGNRFFDSAGNVKSMAEISDVLSEALRGQTKEQQLATLSALFGSDAIRAASVVADGGSAKFDKLAESIGKVGADEVAAKRLDNLDGDLQQLGGSIETLEIKSGSLATKGLRQVVQGLTGFVNVLANPPDTSFMDPLVDASARLRPAWDDLVGTGEHIVVILGDMWDVASPAAAVLAKLGAGATIQGILAVAGGVESVTRFLAENKGLVEAVTLALIAMGAVKVFGILADGADRVALKLYDMAGSFDASKLVQNVGLVTSGLGDMGAAGVGAFTNADNFNGKFSGGLQKTKTGVGNLTSALSSGAVVFALATVSIASMFQEVQSAAADAQRQVDELKPKNFNEADLDSLKRYAQALRDQRDEAQDADHKYDGLWQTLKAGVEVALPGVESGSLRSAKALGALGSAADQVGGQAMALEATLTEIARLTGLSAEAVDAWLKKLNLDPMDGPQWEIAKKISEATDAARTGTPVTDGLAESYGTLADQTSNSADKMKAWKKLVDSIIGTQMSVFDQNTALASSLAELTMALATNGSTMDENTGAGQKNRQALSDAAQQALDTAEAYGNTYGIDAANLVLATNRDRLIASGEAAGISRADMEKYLDTLGLTPENVQTIIQTPGLAQRKGDIETYKGILDGLDGREISTTIRIHQAIDSLGSGASPGMINAERHAKGGDVRKGAWSLVGEEGPELVQFGADGHVFTASQTQGMLGGLGSGIPDGAYADRSAGSKVAGYLVAIRQEIGKGNESAGQLGKDTVAAVVGKGDETAGGIGKVEAAVREGAAYQRAVASVLQADMAHRALGPAGYAEWSVALSNLFQGRTGDVWTPGNDHGPAWDKAPSSEHAPSHTKLRQLTDTASPADGTGAAARRTGPLFTVEGLVIEERMDIDRFAQDADFQLTGAGL